MEKRLDISVVVPLYNEEESLPELTAWIDRVARENGLSYEIVFVDDGSTDRKNTIAAHGKSAALVERLKEHYRWTRRGLARRSRMRRNYDMVSGWKLGGKRWPSKFFNWTARTVSGIKLHDFNCGLKAYRRKVVKSITMDADFRRIGDSPDEIPDMRRMISRSPRGGLGTLMFLTWFLGMETQRRTACRCGPSPSSRSSWAS